jgi:hypothetical protein
VPITKAMELPLEGSRRSSRPVIPSTRAEKMNEIGSKDTANKENQVSRDTNVLPSGPPEWMRTAHAHLLSCDLGNDWSTCVETWFRLEEKLEFGAQGKVACSPSSTLAYDTNILL